jgi:predicted phosphate transport protein (TIGR00153 family)
MLSFVSFSCFLGALITAFFGVETKKQSLEVVSEIFKSFYEQISKMALNIVRAAKELRTLASNMNDADQIYPRIKQIEHQNDELVHEVFTKLNRSFAAPFEQNEISSLTKSMDDVIDMIHAAAIRIKLYEIRNEDKAISEFSENIYECATLIYQAIEQLPNIRGENTIHEICIKINENLCDTLLNQSVASLFRNSDPVKIIKLKEVYEYLEIVTDKCEDVADVLRDLLVKYS